MNRASIVALALLAGSCSSGSQYAQAVVALVDVSGTYADQRPEVVNVIRKGVLPRLTPGDTLGTDEAIMRATRIGGTV